MHTVLISIPTPTYPLYGACYTPDGPIKEAALYFHGNQMNFYVGAARFEPLLLNLWGLRPMRMLSAHMDPESCERQ